MSQYVAMLASAFAPAPGPVKGVSAASYAASQLVIKLITGNPDKVEGYAPVYQQVGSQVSALSGQTAAAAAVVGSWSGPTRAAFDVKINNLRGQLDQLGPSIADTSELLRRAAQTSRQAGEQIVQIWRQTVQTLTAAYYKAKAAAASSFGSSMALFFAKAVVIAAQALMRSKGVSDRANAVLEGIGSVLSALGSKYQDVKSRMLEFVRGLDLPGRAQDLASVIFSGGKEMLSDAWGSLEGKGKADFKSDKDYDGKWGNERDKDSSPFSLDAKAKFAEREGTLLDLFNLSGGGERTHYEQDLDGNLTGNETLTSGEYELKGGIGGDSNAFISKKGLGAEGSVYAGIQASAEGSVSTPNGLVSTDGKVNAMAGAEADGRASIGHRGVEAKGEAFAGAKAEATGGVQAGGIGLQGTVEGWAGAGASGGANVTWEDGKLTVGANLGAAAGLGGKLGGEVTLEPAKTVQAITSGAKAVGNWFTD